MEEVVHLVIKKEYAASVINQLIKEEAVEVINDDEEMEIYLNIRKRL